MYKVDKKHDNLHPLDEERKNIKRSKKCKSDNSTASLIK